MKYRITEKSIYLTTWAAFLIYTLLPFFAVYSNPSESKQLSSLFGEKVLICTSDGFKFVSWEDLAGKDAPKPHNEIKCPLCYFASHGTHYAPHSALLALAYDAYAITLQYRQFNEILLSRSTNSHYQPRAPPPLSIT